MIRRRALFRDLKHVLDLRTIYHRKEERIRAHITLCFLPWCWSGSPRPPPATPGHSSAKGWSACIWASPPAAPAHHPAHRYHPRQRELRALEIKEPQLALDVQAVRARR
jgi:hypothetical protein